MARAFELAQDSCRTHPNPRVGAVVVDISGEVVGEGNHFGPGHAHAEVVALNQAGTSAEHSTVYVTLEPCNHQGRTPPCTDALIEAKVGRVIVAIKDPDLQVSGQGIDRLQESGIDVVLIENSDAARRIDPAYFHHRETGMPLVTTKWAMTLDGSVAAADGSSKWITSEDARLVSHEKRVQSDAVVIGAGTLRQDDPLLTARTPGSADSQQPIPVVIAGLQPLPHDRQVWSRDPIVVSASSRELPGGELLLVDGDQGFPDPVETCRILAERGLLEILLEGGPRLAGSWWNAGVVTEGMVWLGPKIGGGTGKSPLFGTFASITDADVVSIDAVRNVGDNVLITFKKK